MTNKDPLYSCFEDVLEFEEQIEDEEQLVKKVIESYWPILFSTGHVHESHLHEIKTDLEEEVQTMLKTKLYGFFSLKQYRMIKRGGHS